jgi:tRNA A-37 threonylcarbamoyl transferase component Bud32
MSQNDWVGKTLSGRYQIEELLGQGGMSAVYKAMDPNLRRVVAVKMIHPHMSDNEEFVRRFEEEATAVAQLRHENIVQVYDFNNDSGTYYMVLEFVAGETLQQRMKRLQAAGRQLSYTDAVKYIIDVCEAADYAHKRGMIHRDIKPANVILDIHGRAILMDFGIAKIVGGQQHTATGAVIGTALYMAPEQIRGEKIDEGVDIYAIGVTLFEMLNGRPPYEADSAMTLMMMHLNDPIPDLRALHPEVPDDLVAVVDKALSKNRAQRYRSAAEMSAALRKVLERLQKQAPASATIAEAGKAGVATGTARVETPAAPPAPSGVSTIPAERGERVVQVLPSNGGAQMEAAVAASGTVGGAVIERTSASPASTGTGTGVNTPSPLEPTERISPAAGPRNNRSLTLIAGGAGIALILLCVIVGGALAFGRFSGGTSSEMEALSATQTELALVMAQPTTAEPTATSAPTATPTQVLPTETLAPGESPTPTLSPTPTVPPGIRYVRINDIQLDSDGNYLVYFDTFEFTPQLDSYHLTFFFDTLPPEQTGSPYDTFYYMSASPPPFAKFNVSDRPEGATKICVLVANPDHTSRLDSGNCYPLPDSGTNNGLLLNNSNVTDTATPTGIPPTPKTPKEKKEPNY